jgi:hypothetical protein
MDLSKTNFFTPHVWGPHYWFFLHTIAESYPITPNSITKKKYYDFVQNIPMFLPVEEISTYFSKLLNDYPVQPYLDNRESFIKWFWFIHNKINEKLEKPVISLKDFYIQYYEQYKSTNTKLTIVADGMAALGQFQKGFQLHQFTQHGCCRCFSALLTQLTRFS